VKVSYDPSGDVLYISLRAAAVEHTEEIHGSVLADYDSEENIVGFEVLNASSVIDSPAELLFSVHQVPAGEPNEVLEAVAR
jgi:uncharacterized protein YuzE